MMGLRNLYKVFNESRKSTRKRATVAVTGEGPRAEGIASSLGAERSTKGAEVIVAVHAGGKEATVSGKLIDYPDDISLPADDEELQRNLARRVVRALDEDYLVALARGYPAFRHAVCEELIRNNARQNAFVGALPIPGADMPVMTANQGRMVLSIAAAYGERLTIDRARELLAVLAGGFGLRALTRQVVKLVPVGGWAASAAIGYAGTVAMGRATVLYFERGGQHVGEKEMERIRARAAEEGRSFVARWRERRAAKK